MTCGDQCQLFHLHYLVLQTVRLSEISWWYEHSDQHNNDSLFLNYDLHASETWWRQTHTLLSVRYNFRLFPINASQSTLLLIKVSQHNQSHSLFQYLHKTSISSSVILPASSLAFLTHAFSRTTNKGGINILGPTMDMHNEFFSDCACPPATDGFLNDTLWSWETPFPQLPCLATCVYILHECVCVFVCVYVCKGVWFVCVCTVWVNELRKTYKLITFFLQP